MDDGMYDGMGDYNDTNYYGGDDMNYEGGMYDDDYYDEKSFAEIIYELKFNEK